MSWFAVVKKSQWECPACVVYSTSDKTHNNTLTCPIYLCMLLKLMHWVYWLQLGCYRHQNAKTSLEIDDLNRLFIKSCKWKEAHHVPSKETLFTAIHFKIFRVLFVQWNRVLKSQVILYSGEPLWHHVEMAYLNTYAKSYSTLFKWSSASIFSNRVPNQRPESADVFRILFDSINLTLSCRDSFEETKVSQKCSSICVYFRGKKPITRSCLSVQ